MWIIEHTLCYAVKAAFLYTPLLLLSQRTLTGEIGIRGSLSSSRSVRRGYNSHCASSAPRTAIQRRRNGLPRRDMSPSIGLEVTSMHSSIGHEMSTKMAKACCDLNLEVRWTFVVNASTLNSVARRRFSAGQQTEPCAGGQPVTVFGF